MRSEPALRLLERGKRGGGVWSSSAPVNTASQASEDLEGLAAKSESLSFLAAFWGGRVLLARPKGVLSPWPSAASEWRKGCATLRMRLFAIGTSGTVVGKYG